MKKLKNICNQLEEYQNFESSTHRDKFTEIIIQINNMGDHRAIEYLLNILDDDIEYDIIITEIQQSIFHLIERNPEEAINLFLNKISIHIERCPELLSENLVVLASHSSYKEFFYHFLSKLDKNTILKSINMVLMYWPDEKEIINKMNTFLN